MGRPTTENTHWSIKMTENPCNHCGEVKPLTEFRRANSIKNGAPDANRRKHPNFLKHETSEWDTTMNDDEVTCHHRLVEGVLCRWWGDGPTPDGVALIDAAASAVDEQESDPPVIDDDNGDICVNCGDQPGYQGFMDKGNVFCCWTCHDQFTAATRRNDNG